MINQSINCCVDCCKHHMNNHCMLDHIMVGECGLSAKSKSDTECSSFEMK